MKHIFLYLIFLSLVPALNAQQYDQALATELGADELGMKSYVS